MCDKVSQARRKPKIASRNIEPSPVNCQAIDILSESQSEICVNLPSNLTNLDWNDRVKCIVWLVNTYTQARNVRFSVGTFSFNSKLPVPVPILLDLETVTAHCTPPTFLNFTFLHGVQYQYSLVPELLIFSFVVGILN
jgi:hypothetical protein